MLNEFGVPSRRGRLGGPGDVNWGRLRRGSGGRGVGRRRSRRRSGAAGSREWHYCRSGCRRRGGGHRRAGVAGNKVGAELLCMRGEKASSSATKRKGGGCV